MRRIPIIGALTAAFFLFFATAPAYANDIQSVTADGCTAVTVSYANFPSQPTPATVVVTRGTGQITDVEQFVGNGHVTIDVSALTQPGDTGVTVDWTLDGQHHHYGTTLDTSCVPPTTTTSTTSSTSTSTTTVPETTTSVATSTSVPETSTSVSTSVPTTTTLVPPATSTTGPPTTVTVEPPPFGNAPSTSVPSSGPAAPRALPNTGSDTGPAVVVSAVTLLTGLAAVVGTKRRRR